MTRYMTRYIPLDCCRSGGCSREDILFVKQCNVKHRSADRRQFEADHNNTQGTIETKTDGSMNYYNVPVTC